MSGTFCFVIPDLYPTVIPGLGPESRNELAKTSFRHLFFMRCFLFDFLSEKWQDIDMKMSLFQFNKPPADLQKT